MVMRPQRVGELLAEAGRRLETSGSDTARLDAEVLLAYVLGIDRSGLAAHPEAVLSTGQLDAYDACVARRASGEPVAYIRGLKEFYGMAVAVDARVLIPRPETETLVELALERIRHALTAGSRGGEAGPYLVWDVGTGSGAIVVAVAAALRKRRYGEAVRFIASDLSDAARDVAIGNVVAHGLAHLVTFAQGDLVDVTPPPARPVDLLLANLPYIPTSLVPGLPVAASFEPAAALDGGDDGLDIIRRLLPRVPSVLAPAGVALLEIGSDQAEGLQAAVAEALPGWSCVVHADLSGAPRVVELERAGD